MHAQMVGGIAIAAGPGGSSGGTVGCTQSMAGPTDFYRADEGAPNCIQQWVIKGKVLYGFMRVSIVCINSQTYVCIYIYIYIIHVYIYIHI